MSVRILLTMEIDAPNLQNAYLRMEPLNSELYCTLRESGGMDFIFGLLPAIPKSTAYDAYYKYMVRKNQDYCIYPYALLDRLNQDRFSGVSAFIKPHKTHRRVQIGYTWIHPEARMSHVHSAMQYLMIERALNWGARRIEAHVESGNKWVINEIQKLGGQLEGVLRQYQKSAEGSWVDIAVLSFMPDEARAAMIEIEKQMEHLAPRALSPT